jgi:hypothetical protein
MTITFDPGALEAAAIRQDELAREIAILKRDATQAMLDGDFELNTLIMKSLAIMEAEQDIARYSVAIEQAAFRLQMALADLGDIDL